MEHNPITPADDTKCGGTVYTGTGRAATQRDHEGLEEQVCRNHTNPPRTKPKPCMWELSIPCGDTDWGAALLKETRDNMLSVSPQHATAAKVATTTLGCDNRSAASRRRQAITPLRSTAARSQPVPSLGPPLQQRGR